MKRTLAKQLLDQGIVACKAGQSEQARRLLLQTVALAPDSEPAWLWLSQAAGGMDARRHCLQEVLRINPRNAHARAGLVWLEQQAAGPSYPQTAPPDPVDVARQLDQDLKKEALCPFCGKPVAPQNATCPHCLRAMAVACPECEARVHVEEVACPACGRQLGDYRQGASFHAVLGVAYLLNSKADLAISTWRQVLAVDASFPDAYLRLAEAQMMAGDWNGAQSSLEQAISQSADPLNAHLMLGRVFEQQQRWDEAKTAYERALEADQSSATAVLALGRLLMEEQAFQNAFPHIRRATELGPERAAAWFLLGQLYEMAREYRKAIQSYERATDLTGRELPENAPWCERASERLELLRPSLPSRVALSWPETIRQSAGMVFIPAVAALVNGGLRPWQISPADLLGVLVSALGAYFWVSASAMPRNPGMRAMLGQDGLSQPVLRAIVGVLGGGFWAMGLVFVLFSPIMTWSSGMG